MNIEYRRFRHAVTFADPRLADIESIRALVGLLQYVVPRDVSRVEWLDTVKRFELLHERRVMVERMKSKSNLPAKK